MNDVSSFDEKRINIDKKNRNKVKSRVYEHNIKPKATVGMRDLNILLSMAARSEKVAIPPKPKKKI